MAEAIGELEFLITEHDFTGPQVTQDGDYPLLLRVGYHRSDLDLQVTLMLSYMGEESVTAEVVEPRPGSRITLSEATAHTGYQMRRGISRHARAIREFLHQHPSEGPDLS